MKNKLLVAIITLGFLLIITGFLNILTEENSNLLIDSGFTISIVGGFLLLLINGTFLKTKLSKLSFAIYLIGALFKIMHWPFAGPILAIAFINMIVFYSIHFYQKTNKTHIDSFKLIVFILLIIGKSFSILHLPYSWEIQYMSEFIFLLFIVYYIITERKNGKLVMN
jgi:hypothetical protein